MTEQTVHLTSMPLKGAEGREDVIIFIHLGD